MNRRLFSRTGFLALLTAPTLARAEAPKAHQAHRIAFHVGGGSADSMNETLSNIVNAATDYAQANEAVAIELVANGPGYSMLREDTSPVKERIAEVHRRFPFVVFSACSNTRRGIARAENKTPDQIPEVPQATDVPSGVVRLSELQEQGWSYIRV